MNKIARLIQKSVLNFINFELKIQEINKNSDYIIIFSGNIEDDALAEFQKKFQNMVNGQVVVVAGASIEIIRIKDENTHKKQ